MPWNEFWTILLQAVIACCVLAFPVALLVGTIVGAWAKNGGRKAIYRG